jgi:hypothetical protein
MPHALHSLVQLTAALLAALLSVGLLAFAVRVGVALLPSRRAVTAAVGRRFLLIEHARFAGDGPPTDPAALAAVLAADSASWWGAPDPNPTGTGPAPWDVRDAVAGWDTGWHTTAPTWTTPAPCEQLAGKSWGLAQ